MIYILLGNDSKKKNIYLKKLCKNGLSFVLEKGFTKEELFDKAESVSLFGDVPIVIIDNIIKEKDVILSDEELSLLKEAKTTFVFLEEKLSASDIKKYKKYAIIEDFGLVTIKQVPKMNIFSIGDSFSRRDKIKRWILYREAVSQGIPPEEISGIVFWKIKTMILSGTKFFSTTELKRMSSNLLSLYHMAHKGELDFTIGLEQFILSSLSK